MWRDGAPTPVPVESVDQYAAEVEDLTAVILDGDRAAGEPRVRVAVPSPRCATWTVRPGPAPRRPDADPDDGACLMDPESPRPADTRARCAARSASSPPDDVVPDPRRPDDLPARTPTPPRHRRRRRSPGSPCSPSLAVGLAVTRPWVQQPACPPVADHPEWSVARRWDEALLDAIRRALPAPTVHARNLFHTSAAMWDAWAAYDPTAPGLLRQGEATPRPT